jgi:transposase
MSTRERISRNGLTAAELARRTGKHITTIQRWTSEPREAYEARAEERRHKVVEMRKQGMTMRAIAAELGVSLGLVATYAKQAEQERASA